MSRCSPPGKDWIEVCVFFFFCTGVIFLGFWALIWNMKLPDPKAHWRVGEIHRLALNNIFPPLVMEESPDRNHSAAGNFQTSFLCVFSGIWTSLENVSLQQRIAKWGLVPWPSLGKLSVGTSCHLWWATVAKGMLCGTQTRWTAPGCTQGMYQVVQCCSPHADQGFLFAWQQILAKLRSLSFVQGWCCPFQPLWDADAEICGGRKRSSCLQRSPVHSEHLLGVRGVGQKVFFRKSPLAVPVVPAFLLKSACPTPSAQDVALPSSHKSASY